MAFGLMFGNEMLLTSWLSSCLLSAMLLMMIPETWWEMLPTLIRVPIHGFLLPVITFVVKMAVTKLFQIHDDVSRNLFYDVKNCFLELLETSFREIDDNQKRNWELEGDVNFLLPLLGSKSPQLFDVSVKDKTIVILCISSRPTFSTFCAQNSPTIKIFTHFCTRVLVSSTSLAGRCL